MSATDVLILSTVEGHYSIACAAADALREGGLSVHIAVCPDRILRVYRFFSRYRPSLLKVFCDLLHVPLFFHAVSRRLRRGYTPLLMDLVARHAPRIIVSTNWAFEPSMSRHKRSLGIPYVNIVTDPRTFFLLDLSTCADVNFVFDETIAESFRRLHPRVRARAAGWLVRRQFAEPADREKAKESVGLEKGILTILVAAGSEGTNQVLKILPGLLTARRPVQIVVACGNNERMIGLVRAAAGSRARAAHVRLVALPFTREIHRYMQAADLVVGKAGPNMLFEAASAGAPFFAITHNHGQEDGNLDLIREHGAGLVEENPWRARALLRRIIEDPGFLARFAPGIRALARGNRDAPEHLRAVVGELLAAAGAGAA